MQLELSQCLENCRTAATMVRLAEAKVKQAAQECDAAKEENSRVKRVFNDAFHRAGGVTVSIRDDGYRSMRDDPMGMDAARNLFVAKYAMLASGKRQEISKLEIPINASRARTVQGLYESFQASAARVVVVAFIRLVDKLIEERVLSAEDRLVVVDGRYFMKEGDEWVKVWPIRPDD